MLKMIANIIPRYARVAGLILLLAAVSACVPMRGHQPRGSAIQDPRDLAPTDLATRGEHKRAAEQWLAQARTEGDPRRQQAFRVYAAEQFLLAKDGARAGQVLNEVDVVLLDAEMRGIAGIVRGALLLDEGRAVEALAQLPPQLDRLPESSAELGLYVRGRARLATGALVPGLRDLILRETYLAGTEQINANHVLIWAELMHSSDVDLRAAQGSARDPVLRGWLELSQLAKAEWLEPVGFEERLQRWRVKNATHPALYGLYDQMLNGHRQRQTWPASVGLLLPLSGRFAAVGQAVRDGFMAGYYLGEESGVLAAEGLPPEVRVYDTSASGADVVSSYREAVSNGARIVVGPLRKEALEALSRQSLSVPVLALNYLDRDGYVSGLYQFGLSPEGEAAQVAEQAVRAGHRLALSLTPSGDWGERVRLAFEREFEARGGTLLDWRAYDPAQQDHAEAIEGLLRLGASADRVRQLERLLGARLQSEPRRRQDVDMIFLGASAAPGRLLRPQLKFHHAADLPVYSTSHIYGGTENPKSDRDLDGLQFADMPWVLGKNDGYSLVRKKLAQHWSNEVSRHNRLYALGFDAYRVLPLLVHQQDSSLPWYFAGATGLLQLDANARLHRQLDWARFANGRPVPLKPVAQTAD